MLAAVLAAEPKATLIGPWQAAALAAADIVTVPQHDQCFQFYAFFSEPNNRLEQAAHAWAVNSAVSHASTLIEPVPCCNGFALRWDIRKLCPQEKDFQRFVKLRELKLPVIEPDFHKAELLIDPQGNVYQKVACAAYTAGGQTYHYKTIPIQRAEQFALGANIEAMLLLHSLTNSNVPIVRAEWFNQIIDSTLTVGKAKGLYYEFVGVKGLNEKQVFELFGADADILEKLQSDERAALFNSAVTGRQRLLEMFPTQGARLSAAFNMGSVTHDIGIKDVDPALDPTRNLIAFKDRAREGFFTRKNGTQFAYLADNRGVLQDAAPDDVAHDSTVPHPHPQTLQPIVSCWGCHGPKDGWIPFTNDVTRLLGKTGDDKKGNIFDDFGGKGYRDEVLDRLAGLYSGDLSEPVRLAQDSLSKTCFKLTRLGFPEVTGELVRQRNAFVFGRINAQTVLREQGYQVDEAEMTKRFMAICPPLPKFDGRSSVEDPSILAMYTGLTLSRAQYQHVQPDIAVRIATQVKKQRQEVNQ